MRMLEAMDLWKRQLPEIVPGDAYAVADVLGRCRDVLLLSALEDLPYLPPSEWGVSTPILFRLPEAFKDRIFVPGETFRAMREDGRWFLHVAFRATSSSPA